jgi:hypothetical protein
VAQQTQAYAASLFRFTEHKQLDTYTLKKSSKRQRFSSQSPLPTQKNSKETNINVISGIRTRDPSNRTVADLRLRLHGHRDQQEL